MSIDSWWTWWLVLTTTLSKANRTFSIQILNSVSLLPLHVSWRCGMRFLGRILSSKLFIIIPEISTDILRSCVVCLYVISCPWLLDILRSDRGRVPLDDDASLQVVDERGPAKQIEIEKYQDKVEQYCHPTHVWYEIVCRKCKLYWSSLWLWSV